MRRMPSVRPAQQEKPWKPVTNDKTFLSSDDLGKPIGRLLRLPMVLEVTGLARSARDR
jgi:hypothetical protein